MVDHAGGHAVSKQRRNVRRAYWLSLAIVVIGFLPLTILAVQSALNGHTLSEDADEVVRQQSAWPSAQQSAAQSKAEAYNEKLAGSGQPVIGGVARSDNAGGTVDFTGSDDEEYVSTLAEPSGIMGTVEIPSISVNLPIRHGSGDDVLASGAGHLYGTSVPVGGKSTRSVITAHRGVPGKLLFTRLNELGKGDFFYLHVNGRTLAYKVIGSRNVQPDDIDAVHIVKGKDLVTLLTCTPYGVNTERLLVTGERVKMPDPAPAPQNAEKDWAPWLFGAGAVVIILLSIALFKPRKKRVVASSIQVDSAGGTHAASALLESPDHDGNETGKQGKHVINESGGGSTPDAGPDHRATSSAWAETRAMNSGPSGDGLERRR